MLPGCVGVYAGSAPVDIVRVAAADPAAWSHVRRYTIPDMWLPRKSLCRWRPDRARLLLIPPRLPPRDARRAVMARRGRWRPGAAGARLQGPPTASRVYPARAHTLSSRHTHLGCRLPHGPALATGAGWRNGIPGVRHAISGVVDPRGCERPRPQAAAGTTGVAAVRGSAAAARPTPHNRRPCPHGHTECSCAWIATPPVRGGVRDVLCPWRVGGGREAVRPGHHTPHTACRSPRTSHSPPEHRPSTQRHTRGRPQLQPQVQPKVCWAAVVDATSTDSAGTAHR